MSTINGRIKEIISVLGIRKVDFSRKLKISQSFVSDLCSGKTRPSDRTISDICREFNVNEVWLRTGEGEIFIRLSGDEEIISFMGDVLKGENGDFRKMLITVLSRMTPEEWDLLERKALELLEEMKSSNDEQ